MALFLIIVAAILVALHFGAVMRVLGALVLLLVVLALTRCDQWPCAVA